MLQFPFLPSELAVEKVEEASNGLFQRTYSLWILKMTILSSIFLEHQKGKNNTEMEVWEVMELIKPFSECGKKKTQTKLEKILPHKIHDFCVLNST